jgi:hypothetical protein
MSFTVSKTLSTELVAGLLCDAFEGGSDYWAYISRRVPPTEWTYTEDEGRHYIHLIPLNPGGQLVFTEPDGKEYYLTQASVQHGLQIMSDKYPRHFADAINGNDDAETGDVFLQCCLFGEVIYG